MNQYAVFTVYATSRNVLGGIVHSAYETISTMSLVARVIRSPASLMFNAPHKRISPRLATIIMQKHDITKCGTYLDHPKVN